MSSLSCGPRLRKRKEQVRDRRDDEDIMRQDGVQQSRQGQNTGSMSLNVWKKNARIDGSHPVWPVVTFYSGQKCTLR